MNGKSANKINISQVRTDTPGCRSVLHFNNAGAALMSQSVLNAVTNHLRLEAEVGGYEAASAANQAFGNTYAQLARFLNCSTSEVALMENATVAWQAAFYGLARGLQPGDRILTAEAEYASNYIAFLQMAEQVGFFIETVPSTETGETVVWPGVTRENIGYIRPRSNAARRNVSSGECCATFPTDC